MIKLRQNFLNKPISLRCVPIEDSKDSLRNLDVLSISIANESFPFIFLILLLRLDYIINLYCFILYKLPCTSILLKIYSTLFYFEFFSQITISIVVEPSSQMRSLAADCPINKFQTL